MSVARSQLPDDAIVDSCECCLASIYWTRRSTGDGMRWIAMDAPWKEPREILFKAPRGSHSATCPRAKHWSAWAA